MIHKVTQRHPVVAVQFDPSRIDEVRRSFPSLDVELREPEIVFSGRAWYVSTRNPEFFPDRYLQPDGPDLPFVFYEGKTTDRKPATPGDPQVMRYLDVMKWDAGKLFEPHYRVQWNGGSQRVAPGDWILFERGVGVVLTAKTFEAAYLIVDADPEVWQAPREVIRK